MSLRDSRSFKVSRTLLSILADLNSAVVWMVSTRPLISKSSSPCTSLLVTVPSVPITIGITVIFTFHSFLSSLARSKYLSLFSYSFSFILWSTGTAGLNCPCHTSLIFKFQMIFFILVHKQFMWITFIISAHGVSVKRNIRNFLTLSTHYFASSAGLRIFWLYLPQKGKTSPGDVLGIALSCI